MPKRVIVDIELLMPRQLEKDLQEHQQICVTCKGLGIVIRDNEYGLSEEPWIRGFPYKHQSLFPCPDCYNGVQPVCKFCGSPGSRRYVHAETECKCADAQNARNEKHFQEEKDRWEKAEKVSYEEALKRFVIVYIDGHDEYVDVDDLMERLEEIKLEDPELPTPYIWGTYTTQLSLPDASDLVEDACEELFEEAAANISREDINSLQDFLVQWTNKVKGDTTTFWPDYKIGILVD